MNKNIRWIVVILMLLAATTLACSLTGGGDPTPTPEPTPTNTPPPAPADTGSTEESNEEPEATAVPSPTPVPAPVDDNEDDNGNDSPANENEASSSGSNENSASPNENNGSDGANSNGSTAEPPPVSLDPFAVNANLEFDSYTIKFLVEFEGKDDTGETVNQNVSASINFTNDPLAMSMAFTAAGIEGAEEFGGLSVAQIDETVYMVLPELGCITSSTAEMDLMEDNPFEDIFSSQEFVEDLGNAEFVGTETINGIETDHYILDEDDLNLDADQEIESAEGHIYLAKDGGFPVKMIIQGVGEFDMFEDSGAVGNFMIEFNLININDVPEIVPPDECENVSDGSEYPVLDDATEFSSFAGLITYKSSYSVKDATAFYDTELAALGWTKNEGEAFVTETSAIVSYTLDAATLNLLINDEGDGTISVTIIVDEGSGG